MDRVYMHLSTEVNQRNQMNQQMSHLISPYTGLQVTWILCLCILPPDSGTLIS